IFKETKILNIKQNAILSAPVLTYSVAFLFFLGVSAPVLTNKPSLFSIRIYSPSVLPIGLLLLKAI
ncbi:MAG: hypothetical protein WAR39_05315, partial [Prevotella sp.]